MRTDDERDELYGDLERRALFAMQEEEQDELDVLEILRDDAADPGAAPESAVPAPDVTLGGYIEMHDRVPAFEGADGQPYTVDIEVEQSGASDPSFVAFLVFIRWAATGAGIMDHVESGDIATGSTEDEARRAALDLSLYEVKTELDAAIERRRGALED